ncbi:MAG TPA: hypothetical protein VLR93_11050 [Patescibacteria group bacterium]|nr:hypothetical protein [Patescibacteria group bacterium]
MRVDQRFLGWGVFFTLLGAIPLAVSQGLIPASFVDDWWRFWPVILIGVGVGLVLRRTAFHFVGGLLVAATCGLMLGSLLAGGVAGQFPLGVSCSSDRSGAAFTDQSGSLTTNGSVSIEMSCGDLTVMPASGTGWTIAGTAPAGRPPEVSASADRLTIRSPEGSWFGSFGTGGSIWRVGLPTDPTLDLSATLNAGTATLTLTGLHLDDFSGTTNAGKTAIDFTGTTLRQLSYTVNAGSTGITLPATSLSGSATVNAGGLALCVPTGTGIRIQSGSLLGSNNYAEKGLIQDGSTWTSPGFGLSSTQIDLSISANAGSVELDPAGGCR